MSDPANDPTIAAPVVAAASPQANSDVQTQAADLSNVVSSTGTSILTVLEHMLSGLEEGIVGIVTAVLAIFMPQLIDVASSDLLTIGNNFRLFLSAVSSGTPWGQALADMMTADWNTVNENDKQLAIDFSEAVATALEKAGVITS